MAIGQARVTRPTADLARSRAFYELDVGLGVLWSFEGHDGFDGVILGLPNERAQLELIASPEGVVPRPTVEDALVLYLTEDHDVAELADRLTAAGHPEVAPDDPTLNPYWPRNGARVFVDPDGYRLVVVAAGERPAGVETP